MKSRLGGYILQAQSGSQFLRRKGDQKTPVLTAANIGEKGQFVDGVFKKSDEKTVKKINSLKLQPGDIVMIKSGSGCGRSLLLNKTITSKFKFISEHLFLIKSKPTIHPEYLWLKLNHPATRQFLIGITNGSGTPFLKLSDLESIPFNINHSESQEKLIRANKLAVNIQLLSNQAESVFRTLEIRLFEKHFGSPSEHKNLSGFSRLNDLSQFIKDGARERIDKVDNGFSILNSSDITPFNLELSFPTKVSGELFKVFAKRVLPQKGDVLLALSGNNRGFTAMMTTSDVLSVRNVAVIRINDEKVSSFLVHYLNHPYIQKELRDVHSRGSGIQYISVSKLRSLEVRLPNKDALDSWGQASNVLSQFRKSKFESDQNILAFSESLI